MKKFRGFLATLLTLAMILTSGIMPTFAEEEVVLSSATLMVANDDTTTSITRPDGNYTETVNANLKFTSGVSNIKEIEVIIAKTGHPNEDYYYVKNTVTNLSTSFGTNVTIPLTITNETQYGVYVIHQIKITTTDQEENRSDKVIYYKNISIDSLYENQDENNYLMYQYSSEYGSPVSTSFITIPNNNSTIVVQGTNNYSIEGTKLTFTSGIVNVGSQMQASLQYELKDEDVYAEGISALLDSDVDSTISDYFSDYNLSKSSTSNNSECIYWNIKEGFVSGKYHIGNLYIYDNNDSSIQYSYDGFYYSDDNGQYMYDSDYVTKLYIEGISQVAAEVEDDNTKPIVNNIVIKNENVTVPGKAYLELNVTDISSIVSANAYFVLLDDENYGSLSFDYKAYDPENNTATITDGVQTINLETDVYSDVPAGKYYLSHLDLMDQNGNKTIINSYDGFESKYYQDDINSSYYLYNNDENGEKATFTEKAYYQVVGEYNIITSYDSLEDTSIIEYLSSLEPTNTEQSVEISVDNDATVNKDLFNAIKGKNINLIFKNENFRFVVNGNSISADLDEDVTFRAGEDIDTKYISNSNLVTIGTIPFKAKLYIKTNTLTNMIQNDKNPTLYSYKVNKSDRAVAADADNEFKYYNDNGNWYTFDVDSTSNQYIISNKKLSSYTYKGEEVLVDIVREIIPDYMGNKLEGEIGQPLTIDFKLSSAKTRYYLGSSSIATEAIDLNNLIYKWHIENDKTILQSSNSMSYQISSLTDEDIGKVFVCEVYDSKGEEQLYQYSMPPITIKKEHKNVTVEANETSVKLFENSEVETDSYGSKSISIDLDIKETGIYKLKTGDDSISAYGSGEDQFGNSVYIGDYNITLYSFLNYSIDFNVYSTSESVEEGFEVYLVKDTSGNNSYNSSDLYDEQNQVNYTISPKYNYDYLYYKEGETSLKNYVEKGKSALTGFTINSGGGEEETISLDDTKLHHQTYKDQGEEYYYEYTLGNKKAMLSCLVANKEAVDVGTKTNKLVYYLDAENITKMILKSDEVNEIKMSQVVQNSMGIDINGNIAIDPLAYICETSNGYYKIYSDDEFEIEVDKTLSGAGTYTFTLMNVKTNTAVNSYAVEFIDDLSNSSTELIQIEDLNIEINATKKIDVAYDSTLNPTLLETSYYIKDNDGGIVVQSQYGGYAITANKAGTYHVYQISKIAGQQFVIPFTVIVKDSTHEHEMDDIETIMAASCKYPGTGRIKCKNCDYEEYVDLEIDPNNHNYYLESQSFANCEREGIKTYKCSYCDNEKEEPTAATGHKFDTNTNVYKDSNGNYVIGLSIYCQNGCSKNYYASTVYTEKEDKLKYINNSQTETNTPATCTTKGTIIIGANFEVNIDGYSAENNIVHVEKTVTTPATGHDWKEKSKTQKTCTSNGTITYQCDNCEEEKIEVDSSQRAEGHDWVIDKELGDGTVQYKCKKCDQTCIGSKEAVDHLTINNDSVKDGNLSINLGDIEEIEAIAYSAKNEVLTDSLSWKTSDASIVKVNNGIIEAVSEGKAVVTCMATSGAKTTIVVNVTNYPTSVTINNLPTGNDDIEHVMYKGDTHQLNAVNNSGTTKGILYKSDKKDVAIITKKGQILALSPGTTTITAYVENNETINQSFELTVLPSDIDLPYAISLTTNEKKALFTPIAHQYLMGLSAYDDTYKQWDETTNSLSNDYVSITLEDGVYYVTAKGKTGNTYFSIYDQNSDSYSGTSLQISKAISSTQKIELSDNIIGYKLKGVSTGEDTNSALSETAQSIVNEVIESLDSDVIDEDTVDNINNAIENNQEISTKLTVTSIDTNEIDEVVLDGINKQINENDKVSFVDVSVSMIAIDGNNEVVLGNIPELSKEISITITVDNYDANKTYYVLREHNDVVEAIEATNNGDGTITFKTDKFCTVALNEHTHTYAATYSSNASKHWLDATCSHDVKSSEADHIWSDYVVTTPATETEEGEKTARCTVCGATKTQPIDKLSKSEGENEHIHTYASTYTFDENKHWYAATCGHDVKSSEADHTWSDYEVTTPATETEEGVKTARCKVCGYERTETISKLTKESNNASSNTETASTNVVTLANKGTSIATTTKASVTVGNTYTAENNATVKTLSDTTVSLKNKTVTSKQVSVPASVTINGKEYKVTTLQRDCFNGATVTKASLPTSITKIAYKAFAGDKKLRVININSKKLTVSKDAFKGLKKSQVKKIKITVCKKFMSKANYKKLRKQLIKAGIKASNIQYR